MRELFADWWTTNLQLVGVEVSQWGKSGETLNGIEFLSISSLDWGRYIISSLWAHGAEKTDELELVK